MRIRPWLWILTLGAIWLASGRARADTTALAATDFTFSLARVDGAGDATTLGADALRTYFSVARCACPTSLRATLALGSGAAAKLGTSAVDAQLMVGSDCDSTTTSASCATVGSSLSLSTSKTSSTTSLSSSDVFAAAGRTSCDATSTTSTRIWAIVRVDGARLSTEPSLVVTLGGAGPKAPTAVTAQSGDGGLLVSWMASGDATTLQGHQVLCSPGPAKASDPKFDDCGTSGAGDGPFARLDPSFVCSGLVAAGTRSVRVGGLENGRAYQIAVVAVGLDGTPSAPSAVATGTPAPTVGFQELYEKEGGTAAGGCAVGGRGAPAAAPVVLVAAAAALAARRRRRARAPRGAVVFVVAAAFVLVPGAARADSELELSLATPLDAPSASPRAWNLELRFAPYRPDVDAEFSARGSSARPFAETFGSSRRLMSALELDRHVLHRGGTWAVGVGIGYTRATAAAFAADLKTRSGDTTALRLIPLSASLVYRADLLRERGSPLVPYAKLGLDCALWRLSDSSRAAVDDRTLGWHAAAGVTLDLAILDPEAGRSLDLETGINQMSAFFEVARASLDGFGAGSALHVGDTTWFAGLMLEL
jgi:hypothetical protein